MTPKETKEAVLAKCQELVPHDGVKREANSVVYLEKVVKTFFFNLSDGEILTTVWDGLDENSPKWLFAAQILGIAGRPEPRPSNDLLRKAFGKGHASYLTSLPEAEIVFKEWLETLPEDPLKADRELARSWFKGNPNTMFVGFDQDDMDCLRRLCGEVTNG